MFLKKAIALVLCIAVLVSLGMPIFAMEDVFVSDIGIEEPAKMPLSNESDNSIELFSVEEMASESPTIFVIDTTGKAGKTTFLDINLNNNPGVALVSFYVNYDSEAMTLKNATLGDIFTGELDCNFNPVPFVFNVFNGSGDKLNSGKLVTLEFEIAEDCPEGEYEIELTDLECINIDEENIDFEIKNGKITIINLVPGDVNGDGEVTRMDLLRLAKYFSGFEVEIDEVAANVNGDESLTRTDLLRLAKYFSGFEVELERQPGTVNPPQLPSDVKIEGVIVDTYYVSGEEGNVSIAITAIDGYDTAEELEKAGYNDYIEFLGSEYVFDATGTDAAKYLAYKVSVDIENFTKSNEKILKVEPAETNNVIEIPFYMFEGYSFNDEKTDYYTFEYYESMESEEPVEAKLLRENDNQPEFSYFINGERATADDFIYDIDETFGEDCAVEGSVILIDNDGNDVYDCAFAEYISKELAVESINKMNYRIISRDGYSIVFDPESEEQHIVFIKDGNEVSFDDIQKGNIITVKDLYGGKLRKVYISSDFVEGAVSSTVGQNIKINGTIYRKSNLCATDIVKSDSGKFFLNYFGYISYAEKVKPEDGDYAFVLDCNTREPIFGAPIYTILMMDKNGEWLQAVLAEKVLFYTYDEEAEMFVKDVIETEYDMNYIEEASDGWFCTCEAEEGYEVLVLGERLIENRVIKYALNSAGEISKITIPKISTAEVDEENFSIAATLEECEYDAERNRFVEANGRGGVDDSTVVYAVNVESNDIADVCKLKEVERVGADIFEDGTSYDGIAYDFTDGVYGCIIVMNVSSGIKTDNPLLVVKDIYKEENEYGEEFLVINGYMDGEEVTFETVADADICAAVEVYDLEGWFVEDFYDNYDEYGDGTIIEVATDYKGFVTDIIICTNNLLDSYKFDDNYDVYDEEGVAYYAGLLIDEELDGYYTRLGKADGVTVVAEINVKNARIYNVDKTRKTTGYSVEDSIEGFLGSFIYCDDALDTDMMIEEEINVCYAVAKVVDGYAIDIVVYTKIYE